MPYREPLPVVVSDSVNMPRARAQGLFPGVMLGTMIAHRLDRRCCSTDPVHAGAPLVPPVWDVWPLRAGTNLRRYMSDNALYRIPNPRPESSGVRSRKLEER